MVGITQERRERAKQLLQEETIPTLKPYWEAVAKGRERVLERRPYRMA